MTRDELIDDIAQVIRDDTVGWNVPDIASAVLARLEALGWRQVGTPLAYELSGRQIATTWPEGATAALITRELLDSMVEEINALRACQCNREWDGPE